MQKIDWKRKLTSRKLWVAVATFVSMLMVSLGATESEASQAVSLIMAGAAVIAYIISEGLIDSANKPVELITEVEVESEEEDVESETALEESKEA